MILVLLLLLLRLLVLVLVLVLLNKVLVLSRMMVHARESVRVTMVMERRRRDSNGIVCESVELILKFNLNLLNLLR